MPVLPRDPVGPETMLSPGRRSQWSRAVPLMALPLLCRAEGQDGLVQLEGWNSIPAGYRATFDIESAPWWLRLWCRTPFLDRFAYPRLVTRGHGWLHAHREASGDEAAAVARGWRVAP